MSDQTSVGAYGFRLEGAGDQLLSRVNSDWPLIRIAQEVTSPIAQATLEIGDRDATVPLVGGGWAKVIRDPPQALFSVHRFLTDDELAHPYLAPIAALHAHWLGRSTFHGGAIVIGESAWGILGRRLAGKSSLLAEANRRGIPILTDDLLVLDDQSAFAGPRSIDLREAAAVHFKAGRSLGVVGRRERWRIDLGPVPVRVGLAGWIFLQSSSSRSGPDSLKASDRLAWLASSRSVKVEGADPTPLLRLAGLPALQVVRPQRWDELPSLFDSILESIARIGTPA